MSVEDIARQSTVCRRIGDEIYGLDNLECLLLYIHLR